MKTEQDDDTKILKEQSYRDDDTQLVKDESFCDDDTQLVKEQSSCETRLRSINLSYELLLLSNFFYLQATVSYLTAAIFDLEDIELGGIPLSFTMLGLGGFGFTLVGLIDYSNTHDCFHMLMFLAGVLAIASVAVGNSVTRLALYLNLMSALLFFLDSVKMVYEKQRYKQNNNKWVTSQWCMAEIGDYCFLIGAGLSVILGIKFLAGRHQKRWDWEDYKSIATDIVSVVSAILWFASALIATIVTIQLDEKDFQERKRKDKEEDGRRPMIVRI